MLESMAQLQAVSAPQLGHPAGHTHSLRLAAQMTGDRPFHTVRAEIFEDATESRQARSTLPKNAWTSVPSTTPTTTMFAFSPPARVQIAIIYDAASARGEPGYMVSSITDGELLTLTPSRRTQS